MTQTHFIRTQIIDLTLARREAVAAVQETVSDLYRRRLIPEAERIFSEHGNPAETVRLDRLELDLGTLPETNFEEELVSRFRQALIRALDTRVGPARSRVTLPDHRETIERSSVELLAYLLTRGVLPWWASQETEFMPDVETGRALVNEPREMARMLRRIGTRARVRRRLVLLLSDRVLEQWIRVLEPADAEFVIRYAHDLQNRQERERLVDADTAEFREAKWELILQHLLVDRGSFFNTKSFLRGTLQGLAARFRLTYAQLLLHLANVAENTQIDWTATSLPQLLRDLYQEDLGRMDAVSEVQSRAESAGQGEDRRDGAGQDQREILEGALPEGGPERWLVEEVRQAWRQALAGAGAPQAGALNVMAFWRHQTGRQALDFWLAIFALEAPVELATRLANWFPQSEWPVMLSSLSGGAATSGEVENQVVRPLEESSFDHRARKDVWQSLWRSAGERLLVGSRVSLEQLNDLVDHAVRRRQGRYLYLDTLAVLTLFRTFFETGRFSPGLERTIPSVSRETWFLPLLAEHAEVLAGAMRDWAKSGPLSKMMPGHLTDIELEAVVEVIEPGNGIRVVAYVRSVRRHEQEEPLVSASPESFRRSVWEFVLDYLLANRGSVFNTLSFLRYNLQHLSHRYQLRTEAALVFLIAAAREDTLLTRYLREIQVGLQRSGNAAVVDSSLPAEHRKTLGLSSDEETAPPGFVTAKSLRHSVLARLQLWRWIITGTDGATETHLQALAPQLWETMALDDLEMARAVLLRHGVSGGGAKRLLSLGGEGTLRRLIWGESRVLHDELEEWLNFLETMPDGTPFFPFSRGELRAHFWQAVLGFLREGEKPGEMPLGELILRALLRLGAGRPGRFQGEQIECNPETDPLLVILEALHRQSADRTGTRRITIQLERQIARVAGRSIRSRPKPAPACPPRSRTPENQPDEQPDPTKLPEQESPIFVSNAGLVLLAPFLPRLHRVCDLLKGEVFRDFAATQRAVHLLQFLVTGRDHAREYNLALNKVLCGLALDVPIVPQIGFTPQQTAAAETLLSSAIAQWPRVASTSIEGFRNSFLWRKGKLEKQDESWTLTVEYKGFDVLLDDLPWSFSLIKHSWMPHPLHVEWV